ncbi:MAG: hypothetical protein LUO93_00145, partial [Methanomicrobiales archaeon]|nr:hypothetical protein [Methanomicrobiales archaeon]
MPRPTGVVSWGPDDRTDPEQQGTMRAPANSPRQSVEPSPHAGVYRYRHLIGGCPVWYRIDESGQLANGAIVRPGMTEAAVVAELAIEVWGDRVTGPVLTLLKPSDGVSRSPRLSPALLARIFRARLSGPPADPPARSIS